MLLDFDLGEDFVQFQIGGDGDFQGNLLSAVSVIFRNVEAAERGLELAYYLHNFVHYRTFLVRDNLQSYLETAA